MGSRLIMCVAFARELALALTWRLRQGCGWRACKLPMARGGRSFGLLFALGLARVAGMNGVLMWRIRLQTNIMAYLANGSWLAANGRPHPIFAEQLKQTLPAELS